MTGTYEWNPMPHKVNICCPSCNELAVFEFCEVVKICKKKDVDYFINNKLFEYEVFQDSCGHKWHGAVYYAGLHGNSVSAISNLPEGYIATDWNHSKYLYRTHNQDIGSVQCTKCSLRKVHNLNWELEAYYSINYKNQNLWAYNRESAQELKKYIESKDRNLKNFKWGNFLLHIPSVFKKQSAREHVTKKLSKLLK